MRDDSQVYFFWGISIQSGKSPPVGTQWGGMIRYLIGYDYEEFCALFSACLPGLQQVFPHCPPVQGDHHPSLHMKLFCFLWRYRSGISFRAMQALTGLDAGQLCHNSIKIERVVSDTLSLLHPPISAEALTETGAMFCHLFTFLGKRYRLACFFDNFYILIPRPGDQDLQESLYSGYKGAHCVKGLLVSKSVGMAILEVTLMYPGIADARSTHTSRIYSMLETLDVVGGGDKGYRSEAHNGRIVTVYDEFILFHIAIGYRLIFIIHSTATGNAR